MLGIEPAVTPAHGMILSAPFTSIQWQVVRLRTVPHVGKSNLRLSRCRGDAHGSVTFQDLGLDTTVPCPSRARRPSNPTRHPTPPLTSSYSPVAPVSGPTNLYRWPSFLVAARIGGLLSPRIASHGSSSRPQGGLPSRQRTSARRTEGPAVPWGKPIKCGSPAISGSAEEA